MKAQADQKKAEMETAMLGGEAEPEGMYDDQYYDEYDYGEEGENENGKNYMGGSKEKKDQNLKVPSGKKKRDRNHGSDEEG